MNTQTIISEIKNKFEINTENENYFAELIEDANNDAIDIISSRFEIGEYDGIEFWEDGISGDITSLDQSLIDNINSAYFEEFKIHLIEATEKLTYKNEV